MNIDDRYRRVLDRRSPATDRAVGAIKDVSAEVAGRYVKYLIAAMAPVATIYTEQLIEQGNRIENSLRDPLRRQGYKIDFRRQGSVSNNTHIRSYSDVDVLVILNSFFWVEAPLQVVSPYPAWKTDFKNLRGDCRSILESSFTAAKVDDSGSTAIKISGASLKCAVDVVPACWADTTAYREQGTETYRGVRVFDRYKEETNVNLPFYFNAALTARDDAFQGVPKALIRLLKTIKADIGSEQNYEWALSSYDICSIVFRMNDDAYSYPDYPVLILAELGKWLDYLENNAHVRDSLRVVDESRVIFDKPEKKDDLAKLNRDIKALLVGIHEENGIRTVIRLHL